jgi:Family of unknown function (DUF6011)
LTARADRNIADMEATHMTQTTTDVNRFAGMYSLFQYAVSQNLKYPKIRLQLGQETIIVKLAGDRSKYTGQLMVTNDAAYGASNNKYFGRVTKEGAIVAGRDLTSAVEELLQEFATHPVEVAQRYGKLTGNCMFCGLKLTDEDSTACGYGPVCARKWNLPHSAAKASRAARKATPAATVVAVVEAPPTPNELIDAVREHSRKNYGIDGWDYVVEALDRIDIADILGTDGVKTKAEAIASVDRRVKLWAAHRDEVTREVY